MNRFYILIFFLFLAIASFAQKAIIDKVVATVGGELILLSDVEQQHALMEAQNGRVPEDARCRILDQLMASKLLIHQARLDSIEIQDSEVEAQLDARIERILTFMNNDVGQFEEYYGQTIKEVKEQFREDLKNQLMAERMRASIMADVTVTPSEVKNFFAEIPEDSLPYFNAEVEIREIVHKPEVSKEERAKTIAQLKDIRQQIMDGADFAEMAMEYSQDGSARIGGDLGWTTRGKFVPEFEAAAYKLEINEVSDIVESEFGFHLIQMMGRRGNSINVRHILLKPEITQADLDKARIHLDSVRTMILDSLYTFSIAVKRFSQDDQQSYNNDGRMVNPVTGNTFFEIGDLDPDIYFTIDTMEVGTISAPFEFKNQMGERMYRIILLDSRSKPHRANLKEDYFKIQRAAIDSKKSEYISSWVGDHISSTYVQIDGLYEGCPALMQRWTGEKIRP